MEDVKTIPAFLDKPRGLQRTRVPEGDGQGQGRAGCEEINDSCDTLRVICRAVQDKGDAAYGNAFDDVRDFIRTLFADNVKGVLTLATYHRSKGREWPRVMLIEHSTRCPSPYAKQAWQLEPGRNLAYVAITRAQRKLVFRELNYRPVGASRRVFSFGWSKRNECQRNSC